MIRSEIIENNYDINHGIHFPNGLKELTNILFFECSWNSRKEHPLFE